MKKILIPVMAAAMCAGMISCSKTESEKVPATLAEAENFQDSIAITFGDYLGRLGSHEVATSADAVSKGEMLRGVTFVMDIDTANFGRFQGVCSGLQIHNHYKNMTRRGLLDYNRFISQLQTALTAEPIEVEAVLAMGQRLDSLMEVATGLTDEEIAARPELRDDLTDSYAGYLGRSGAIEFSSYPDLNIDRNEVLNGIVSVLTTDTANVDYLNGMRMGQSVYLYYRDLAGRTPVRKEVFMGAFGSAFKADTLPRARVRKLKLAVDSLMDESYLRQIRVQESEIYATEAARYNRELAEAVTEKLMRNPDYTPVGNDGLMKHQITPGNGDIIMPDEIVTVDITLHRIDGIQVFERKGQRVMPRRTGIKVIKSLLPYLSAGETAEFFVPYELALGVAGDGTIKVGPCESLFATITVKKDSEN